MLAIINKEHFRRKIHHFIKKKYSAKNVKKRIEITMWQEIMKETGIYMCTTKNQAIKKEICLKMSLFYTLCSLLRGHSTTTCHF